MGTIVLGLITFLAAFLLFEIEFIIAKVFLPGYGGSYLVWGACVVFFQAVLLLGYWFAHHFIGVLGWARYRYLHLGLLFFPLLFFPGRELNAVFVNASLPLVIDVFLRLAYTIGPVFFVLSTMSIATQMWLSRSHLAERLNPYHLYAVSNIGSFAALFSYPFCIELFLDLSQQLTLWRFLYCVLMVVNIAAFFWVPVEKDTAAVSPSKTIERSRLARWVLLGAGGSMIFLSVNNLITYELPPVPLFWVFPLSIYLLSFVLNFKKNPWCPQWMITRISSVIGLSALYYFFIQKYDLPPLIEFSILLGVLFCLCMFCQNQLIRSKPENDGDLTRFYFFISLGSFLGGVITTWIIPLISVSMVEYLCALVTISLSLFYDRSKPLFSSRALRIILYLNLLCYVWSAYFVSFNLLAVAALFFLTWKTYRYLNGFRYGIIVSLLILLISTPVQEKMWDLKATDHTWKVRNYYGIHEVVDSDDVRWLYHGRTLHGGQFLSAADHLKPITYYGPQSGIWDVMLNSGLRYSQVALVGLGTGSIASYFKEGQALDIFELDPEVNKIAHEKFTFLKNSRASQRIFIGDARLSLKSVNDRAYDLMVIDAFGGDAIPVHLLTQEVFKEYQTHLNPKGVILVHVSNRYVDLVPVMARVARSVGAHISFKRCKSLGFYSASSYWIYFTWDEEMFQEISRHENWLTIDSKFSQGRPWTDSYSSILPFMRLDYLMTSLKSFNFFSW